MFVITILGARDLGVGTHGDPVRRLSAGAPPQRRSCGETRCSPREAAGPSPQPRGSVQPRDAEGSSGDGCRSWEGKIKHRVTGFRVCFCQKRKKRDWHVDRGSQRGPSTGTSRREMRAADLKRGPSASQLSRLCWRLTWAYQVGLGQSPQAARRESGCCPRSDRWTALPACSREGKAEGTGLGENTGHRGPGQQSEPSA